MTYKYSELEIKDNIATITLNRPESLNAFNAAMTYEFVDILDACDDNDDIKTIIVTGKGRAFSAGADISSGPDGFADISSTDIKNADGSFNYSSERARDLGGLITLRIYDMKKPMIAAINGAAVGMGITSTLPMDIRLASTKAKFGFVFSQRGIVNESNCSYFLPRTVGISQASEWLLTGRVFGAEEALKGGLVKELYEPEDLLPAAYKIAAEIAENTAPISVALNRQLLWKSLGWSHPMEAHKLESRAVLSRATGADAAEGVASFLEKRTPKFPMKVSKDMPDFYPWWDEETYE